MATDAAPPYEGNHLPQQTLPPSSPVLPLDLIMEILSWVPVKSLIRFRCVSKTWNSLIFDPTFVKLHLYRSSRNTHILLTFLDKDLDTCVTLCSIRGLFENPSSTVDNGYHIFNHCSFVFGVCNGLVCMLDSLQEDEIGEYRVRFWNPATRVMSEDLSFCLRSNDYKIGQYSWQCGYPKCGFGHDDLSDTYKAVVILLDVKSQQRELRVHSMGDTGWRKILTCPAFPILRTQLYGQFVNDCINWLALRRLGCDYRWKTVTIDQLVIFSYDIKKETHRYLLMPDGLSEVPLSEPCLGVLRGYLCLSHDHRRTHFTVWLMREFGVEKSWTRLLNVSYEHLQIHGFPPCTKFIPLCMSENEEVLLLANFGGSELVFYNQRDNRIDRVEDFEPYKSLFLSHDYIQSLVLPY